MSRPHLRRDLAGRHTSVHRDLVRPLRRLQALNGVQRVMLNLFHNCRHKYPTGTLKVQRPVPGGLLVKGFVGDGYQEIIVLGSDLEAVEALCVG